MISICVGTFGDAKWKRHAQQVAIPSAVHQETNRDFELRYVHGENLAEARNKAAEVAKGEWLVFLDADDELDRYYVEYMSQALDRIAVMPDADEPWLLQPSTLGVHQGGREDEYPVLIPSRELIGGNFLIIGTMVRRDQFMRVGGFDSSLPFYEDWDLWIRCALDGARFATVEHAIYRVHVHPGSRNDVEQRQAVRVFSQIQVRYKHQWREMRDGRL